MLSKRQKEAYECIVRYHEKNGFSPTVRELAAALGVKSSSSAHTLIKALEEQGYIKKNANQVRTITVVSLEA